MKFTLDTNMISYLLKGDRDILEKLQNAIISGDKFVINPIVFYEVYRGLLYKKASEQLKRFQQYCNQFDSCGVCQQTFITAAEIYSNLREKGKLIDDADIFIAAVCIQNGHVLITNNEKHFKRINKLKILNWIL